MKLLWHLRKLSITLYTVLRFVCCLISVPTRTECIIRTKCVVYESKFQKTLRSCVGLIPWVLYTYVQKLRTYNVCMKFNTPN